MKFADFLSLDATRADLSATDQMGVIRELVESLVEVGELPAAQQESAIEAIAQREALGTTAIGSGTAIPHAKFGGVDRVIGAVGVCRGGIDFNSLDGEKTDVFFLMLSPEADPDSHLAAIKKTSAHLRDPLFRRFVRQSKTAAEIWEVLNEADEKQLLSEA